MPELGEVAFFRRQWEAACGETVREVRTHPRSRIYRETPADTFAESLTGAKLTGSRQHGKQMLFAFSGGRWLGVHLGMTGTLRLLGPKAVTNPRVRLENNVDVQRTDKHDHLVLLTRRHRLVFSDPRHFGLVRLYRSRELPEAWQALPPEVTDDAFTFERLDAFLARRVRTPVKAVLLMQDMFPGVGN